MPAPSIFSARTLLIAALAVASLAVPSAPAAGPPVSYWRQRLFFIPFQANAAALADNRVAKVELLISPADAAAWKVLQQAEPTVRGFSYHAPADGVYDFAVRTVDKSGAASPVVQPMLRIVVDTQKPTLQLSATTDAAGRLLVRYEATDTQLVWESLRLEMQAEGKNWKPVTLSPADLRQPDRVIGQWTWPGITGVGSVSLRASVADRAGNQALATTQATLAAMTTRSTPTTRPASADQDRSSSSVESGPLLGPAAGGDPLSMTPTPSMGGPSLGPPPASPRTPVQFTSGTSAARNPFAIEADSSSPAQAPVDGASAPTGLADLAPPLLSSSAPAPSPYASSLTSAAATTTAPVGDGWTVPGAMDPREADGRWVNSLTFDLDYELETVGPWGVAKVELWATHDEGRTWTSIGFDDDNRAPMRATVPADGIYGFRIVVDGANGATAPRPRAGERPELVIGVDLAPPTAALMGVAQGQGSQGATLMIRWSAADDHLEARPASLFFAATASGPWTTIATDLENTGEYAWQLPRTMPEQIYLRLDVHDRAGNVTTRQSPSPIALKLPQPTGRIRAIRPVAGDPGRYRTASGATTHPGQ